MKKRILTLTLALSLALLAACGGGGSSSSNPSGSGSQDNSSVSTPDQSQPDGSGDTSSPDASNPDSSAPDGSQGGDSSSTPLPDEGEVTASLSLNKNDFTLFTAGATWQLKASATPAGGTFTWSSSDENVASVSDNGTVTAVAPGTATITVTDSATGLTARCIVRCSWEEQTDSGSSSGSGSSSSGGSSSSSSGGSSSSSSVDLSAFADQVMADHPFGMLQLLDASLLDSLYPGMSNVSTDQCLVYGTMMSMNNGEFGLVQVKDSADVDTVKAIFQARIDGMINGGAWYPEPTRIWTECSRVVSNGNYVMMVVHEDCDAIVDAFNALF